MKLGKKARFWSFISGLILFFIIYFTLLSFTVKPETKLPVYVAAVESTPSCVEITGINVKPSSGMAAIDLTWVEEKGAGKMILVYTGITFRVIQANRGSVYSDLLPHAGFVTITVYLGNEKNECFSVTQIVETNNLPD